MDQSNVVDQSLANAMRLPDTIVPIHYALCLVPNLHGTSKRFKGEVSVTIKVRKAVETIALNALDIRFRYISLQRQSKPFKRPLIGTARLNAELQTATLSFGRSILPGTYVLTMRYTGSHDTGLRGFYKAFWTDDEGEQHVIASTQHEPTEARCTFPCFDEPHFKATFRVRMIVDRKLTALSNARQVHEYGLSRRRKMVEFAVTPPMSTYLTCFIVGELCSSAPAFVNGVELRIWTVPGKQSLTSWAMRCASHSLAWYEWYFGIPYFGGDKIDHVAIPDFEAGAMENVGCVTYRESSLLCDEASATQGELENIAETVIHEQAHFWFGDLVTMSWWNGLWLNEAFATFMQKLCVSLWRPDWNTWDEFGGTRAGALRVDALNNTHAIELPVHHPDAISEMFDAISYNKGCAVLYMLHQFIGFDVFRLGIQIYLLNHALGNTTTGDLWDALEHACHEAELDVPVREMMDGWIFTAGHPVVSVERGDEAGTIKISQKQFLFLPCEPAEKVWPIPLVLNIKTEGGDVAQRTFLFHGAEGTITIGAGFQWVNLNAGGAGVYRVQYETALMQNLMQDLQEQTVIERFNLLSDAWAFVRGGSLSAAQYLKLLPLFAQESDPNVFALLLGSLSVLHGFLPGEQRQVMEKLVSGIVSPRLDDLGWNPASGETIQITELRASMFGVMGTLVKDSAVQAKASELYGQWLADHSSINPNMLAPIVGTLAACGDRSLYEQFAAHMRAAKTPHDRALFRGALVGFDDPLLLEQTLRFALSNEVSIQDAPFLLARLLGNENSQRFTWQFLRDNWEPTTEKFSANMVPHLVRAMSALDKPDLAAEVQEFFLHHEVKAGAMATLQMLEQLEINLRMRAAIAASQL